MTQIIQVKRRIGGAAGGPTAGTLQAGELAFNNADNALYVGADAGGTVVPLVHNQRQLEIHPTSPVQTVAGGAKTFGLANIKIPGGNVGEFLSLNNVDGTLVYAPAVTAVQQFVGSLDAAAAAVTFTTASGATGTALPAAGAANSGWYVICDTAGTLAAANTAGAPVGDYNIGDWVISNGSAWTHLSFGGIETDMAAEIGVVAPITGGSNVQAVLETMQALDATHVVGPATSTLGFIATYANATGKLLATGIDPATLALKGYVDSENTAQETAQDTRDDAQDVLIAANAAAIAAQGGVDAAQNTEIDTKITKPASVLAIGNIATYADLTGSAALDGGESIASLNAKIDAKADIANVGDVVGPASVGADGNIAVYNLLTGKLIKDGGQTIAALTAAVGDVKGQATAIAASDNIAIYSGTNQKAIKDGGTTIGAINAAIAARGDVKGPAAVVIPNNLAAFDTNTGKLIKDSGQSITSIQTYVDTAISAIPASAPPVVTTPDLTGDGSVATPITWTGVKFDATAAANIPPAFTGNGTTATPLALVLVDGGTY